MKTRYWIALAAGLVVVAGAAPWALAIRSRNEREARLERSRLRVWAREQIDGRGNVAAGISLGRPEVEGISSGALRRLSDSPGLPVFLHRCTACHATPDPGLHTSEEWPAVVGRMGGWIERAGLFPLTAEQRAAILRVLGRAAGPEPGRSSSAPSN